jgi:hypothetical protein
LKNHGVRCVFVAIHGSQQPTCFLHIHYL